MALVRSSAPTWTCPSVDPGSGYGTPSAPFSSGEHIHFVGGNGSTTAYTTSGVRAPAADNAGGTGLPTVSGRNNVVGAALVDGMLYVGRFVSSGSRTGRIYRRPWTGSPRNWTQHGADFTTWGHPSNQARAGICADDTYIYFPRHLNNTTIVYRRRISDGGDPGSLALSAAIGIWPTACFTDGRYLWICRQTAVAYQIPASGTATARAAAEDYSGNCYGGGCVVGSDYFLFHATTAYPADGPGTDSVTHLAAAPTATRNLYAGGTQLTALYAGTTRVRRAYAGSVLVWDDPE